MENKLNPRGDNLSENAFCKIPIGLQNPAYMNRESLPLMSGGKGLSPGVVYGKDSGVVRQCNAT